MTGVPSIIPLTVFPTPALNTLHQQPAQTRIDIGLKQMAYVCIAGAIEDFGGRKLSGGDNCSRQREWASSAARWLRAAGKHGRSAPPFTLDWCASILSIDPKWIARNGFSRLKNINLANWRWVRENRGKRQRKTLQRTTKRCSYCGTTFLPRSNKAQQCCSQKCAARMGWARRQRNTEQAEPRTSVNRYALYLEYCDRVGAPPLTEPQWRVLSG
jgi:hypothetical protein